MSLMVDLTGRLSNPLPEIRTTTVEPLARSRSTMQHQVRLTPEQIERLINDRALGYTIKHLPELYGIHRTPVMSHLKRQHSAP